jgi:virginiamycin B lyase
LGKLDPKTAKVTEWELPVLQPGFPKGILDVEQDKEGNMWLAMMEGGGLARFDVETSTFKEWSVPKDKFAPELGGSSVGQVMPTRDGKVWFCNTIIEVMHRLDPSSGLIETFEPYKGLPPGNTVYGVNADSQGNGYFMDFAGGKIGKVDAKTGKTFLFPTPTPNSTPRRGFMDAEDRLWFAEGHGNNIGMFDTRTEKFQEWPVPTAFTGPYDVVRDKNGEIWTGGEFSDRIVRMDPKTKQFVEYLLPDQFTDIRRTDIDNSTNPPTFWVGSTHGAAIFKVEPLD